MSETTLGHLVVPLDAPPTDRTVRELVEEFAGALACSALDRVERLLDEDVVVRTPGRSRLAGDHRGRGAAMVALSAAPVDGVRLAGTRVTEILVDGDRGLVVLELAGAEGPDEFCYEVAFHLAVARARIVGITEYSADQYTADRLLGADRIDGAEDGAEEDRTSSRRTWGRR